jgi:replicative DNA helicase
MPAKERTRKKQEGRFFGALPDDRPLPSDENSERVVLGAMLSDEDAVSAAIEKFLREDVFYSPRNQKIYDAMCELVEKNKPVDPVNLCNILRDNGILEEVGGEEYLIQLQNSVATTANIESWCDNVRDKAIQRRVIRALSVALDKCYDVEESPSTIIGQIETELLKAQHLESRDTVRPIGDVILKEAFPYIDKILRREKPENVVETHFSDLDKFFGGGMMPGEMYVLAARPGVGKTSLAINVITQVALSPQKIPAVFFSMEMTAAEIARRMLYSESKVSKNDILDPSLNNETRNILKNRITAAASILQKAQIFIDPTPALKIMDLRTRVKRLVQKNNVRFVVIDYLQLMHSDDHSSADTRQIEVSLISGGIKAIAKELGIPILVLAQLNRQTEQQKEGKPRLSNLRESGSIEQDADVVMFLHRNMDKAKEATLDEKQAGLEAELIIEKNRNGEIGRVKLLFFERWTTFTPEKRFSHDDIPRRK